MHGSKPLQLRRLPWLGVQQAPAGPSCRRLRPLLLCSAEGAQGRVANDRFWTSTNASALSTTSLASVDTEGPWIALVGDASEACEPGGCSLTMRVFFKSRPGEQLHLVGNHPAFGVWDLTKSLELKWTPNHVWTTEASICVQPGALLEYKYVLFREGEDSEPLWQAGKNMVVHVPEDSEGCKFIVEDSFDSTRHEQHLRKPDEHSTPQSIPAACFACAECLVPHLHWQTCPKLLVDQNGVAVLAAPQQEQPPEAQRPMAAV